MSRILAQVIICFALLLLMYAVPLYVLMYVMGKPTTEALELSLPYLAIAVSSSTTLFYALQQYDLVRATTVDIKLRQRPHVDFSDFKVSENKWTNFKFEQKLSNTGMGNIHISSATITWTSDLFPNKILQNRRGDCLGIFPRIIPPGKDSLFEFKVSPKISSANLPPDHFEIISEKYKPSDTINALIKYYILNAGSQKYECVEIPISFS